MQTERIANKFKLDIQQPFRFISFRFDWVDAIRFDSISFTNAQIMLPLRIDIFCRWRNSFKDVKMDWFTFI